MSDVRLAQYYIDDINLKDKDALEVRIKALIEKDINSLTELESWLEAEHMLDCEISEAMTGHMIDFYRDTESAEKRNTHLHDQTVVQPVLLQYKAELNKKFCDCPFIEQLDDPKYRRVRQTRRLKAELFRQENIALTVREQELQVLYQELMGGLVVEWDGETKSYPFVAAQLDAPDRTLRERAWRALAEVRDRVKPQIDEIMDELVKLRHQMAVNAGFENYRDYMFKVKNREYSVQQCRNFHDMVEKHIVPAWERVTQVSQSELGLDVYRPWDLSAKMSGGAPFEDISELMDGVQEMLGKTDPYFEERFTYMRDNGLFDLGTRRGKAPGGFELPLRASKNAFVFANFAPSFFALIALIHEMGHAVNAYLQFSHGYDFNEDDIPAEVAELYSHAMELLLLDKLNTFYQDERQCQNAQIEELRRAVILLISPLAGDVFQHWLYTNPNHTAKERDQQYLAICKRFIYIPVDISELEFGIVTSWFVEPHIVSFPFYHIEYSLSELGALQLLEIYRQDPEMAINLFKRGAGTDFNQSIAEIYRDTGIEFDFSESVITRTAEFLEKAIHELKVAGKRIPTV